MMIVLRLSLLLSVLLSANASRAQLSGEPAYDLTSYCVVTHLKNATQLRISKLEKLAEVEDAKATLFFAYLKSLKGVGNAVERVRKADLAFKQLKKLSGSTGSWVSLGDDIKTCSSFAHNQDLL